MAVVHQVEVTSRESVLVGFAKSFGRHPPRHPIPEWWEHFEAFYRELRAGGDERSLMLRTEAFEYDQISDEDEDEDER